MIFDAPTITALGTAIGAVLAGVVALIRLIAGNVAKRKAGIAATVRQRDKDLIRELTDSRREISHLERTADTEKRNRNRLMDRWVEARRKAVELYGKEAADVIFGETPRIDATYSYDEIRQIRQGSEQRRADEDPVRF